MLPGPAAQTHSSSHGARLEANAVPVRHGTLVQEAPGASRGVGGMARTPRCPPRPCGQRRALPAAGNAAPRPPGRRSPALSRWTRC